MSEAPPIWIVGVGPGDPNYVTPYVAALIGNAEYVAGFKMPLETAARLVRGEGLCLDYRNQDSILAELAVRASEGRTCVVCAQGDPSFSGRELIQRVQSVWPNVKVVPGVSSIQVLCARAGIELDRSLCLTFHKRGSIQADLQEFLNAALEGRRHVIALPRPWDFMPAAMARFLLGGGVSRQLTASIYQYLTLPQESSVTLTLGELAAKDPEFSDLCIFLLPAGQSKTTTK